jgi:hypothetical protein
MLSLVFSLSYLNYQLDMLLKLLIECKILFGSKSGFLVSVINVHHNLLHLDLFVYLCALYDSIYDLELYVCVQ